MNHFLGSIVQKLKRPVTVHKGDMGRVYILAGSRGMTGAAHLTGMAALRSGAGLVTVGVPEAVYSIIARREFELMVKPLLSTKQGTLSFKSFSEIQKFCVTQNVLAIGPGLSQEPSTQKLVRKVLAKTKLPVVIDADALNALKGHLDILKNGVSHRFPKMVTDPVILTPHPGEFLRVFGGKLDDSNTLRKKRALEVARKYGVVIVLKGHHTVVASPHGSVYVNPTGNPGMATAGSGDVLTGVIAALVGQGLSCCEAACLGVYVHGLAGDKAAKKIGQVSLVAGDILLFLPAVFKNLVSA